MAVLTAGEVRLLETLRDHPFLSRRQLELCQHRSSRMIRCSLHRLKDRGLAQRHNGRQPWMNARSLFSLTPQGVEVMAKRAGVPATEYIRQAGLTMPRLERLLVMTERVFQVRTNLLWLQQDRSDWRWSMPHWDVEVSKLFYAGEQSFRIPFHGAAVMVRPDGQWSTIVVELDLRRVPIEKDRERIVHLVMAQDDRRYWTSENEEQFPVLALIAQDEFRLQDYYTVLRAAAMARQLPLPRAYLTTFSEMLAVRSDPARPIWYSTISGEKRPLLYDTPGSKGPVPPRPPWSKLTADAHNRENRIRGLSPELLAALAQGATTKAEPEEVKCYPAALALVLKPVEKRMLDEIAAHPLLTAEAIAQVLHLSDRQGIRGTRRLAEMDLVRAHAVPSQPTSHVKELSVVDEPPILEKRYLLTQHGMHYLALVAGFENGVRRYAKARGWADGFDTLLQHWEHTREENAFFLGLARIARRRGHELVWLSEPEGRLYYDSGSEPVRRMPHRRPRQVTDGAPTAPKPPRPRKVWRRSFLPDGRGTYKANGVRYDFALEIDRTRMALDKFRRKLTEYYACLTSNVLRGRGIELLRLLIVTNSWERAETLRKTIVEIEQEFQGGGILTVFITTFDLLRSSGADRPIWLRAEPLARESSALTSPKTYCFGAFVPRPQPPREPGQVLYKG